MSGSEELKIRIALIECLKKIQEISGEEEEQISEETVPVGGLLNFDSMRGVIATVLLEKELDQKIPSKGETANIFISDDGKRALCVEEIAINLTKITK